MRQIQWRRSRTKRWNILESIYGFSGIKSAYIYGLADANNGNDGSNDNSDLYFNLRPCLSLCKNVSHIMKSLDFNLWIPQNGHKVNTTNSNEDEIT